MAFCFKCGASLPAGANFCMKCGAKVQNVCPKCGKELPLEANFCFVCGTKIGETEVKGTEQVSALKNAAENSNISKTQAQKHILPAGKYQIKVDETCESGSGLNAVVVDSNMETFLEEECEGSLEYYEENYAGDSFCNEMLGAGQNCGNFACGISPAMMKKSGSKLRIEITGITNPEFKMNFEIPSIDEQNLKKTFAKSGDGTEFVLKVQETAFQNEILPKKFEIAMVYQAWYDYELDCSEASALEDLLVLKVLKDNRFTKLPEIYVDGFVSGPNLKCTGCWEPGYPVRKYINEKF